MDIKKPAPKKKIQAIQPPIIHEQPKSTPQKTNSKVLRKIILYIGLGFIFLVFLYALFMFLKISYLGNKINPNNHSELSITQTIKNLTFQSSPGLKNQSENRINILLLGIAGERNPGQNLTDTIMIASINTERNNVSLLSLPRDLFISLPREGIEAKINSVYQIGLNNNDKNPEKGVELTKEAVQEVTGLPIDYYVILNFDGFKDIVDSVGGVNIMNERDIYDSHYPGENYSYETFELKKGFHHLDGETALKYARERHSDPEGDFGRAKRQQQVLQAIKNNVFSAKTYLNPFAINDLFEILGKNLITNIETDEFTSFVNLFQKLDTQNVNTVVIDAWKKESLLKVGHIYFNETRAFVLLPKAGNWSEIKDVAENIFSLNEIQKRKENIQKENARIKIINASGEKNLGRKIKESLFDHLNYQNVSFDYSTPENKLEKTLVFDLTEKNNFFTLDEIIKTLPVTLSEESDSLKIYSPENNDDFDLVIVLGKDLIDIYNVEEGTIEDLENQNETLK